MDAHRFYCLSDESVLGQGHPHNARTRGQKVGVNEHNLIFRQVQRGQPAQTLKRSFVQL
jgi:hypothetical protein